VKFRAVKGTKDILPAESFLWHETEEMVRAAMHRFNYREIRTPVFEETSLFARGIGELTDIVGKEMYSFKDRSDTSLTLKPEMTAAVVRAYIQNNLGEQSSLVKLFYISPMFRQERPQAGRLRQFHQYGAEAIGGSHYTVDADIIALAVAVLEGAGISNYRVRINSVGCEKCRPAYKEKLKEFFRPKLDNLSEESRARFDQNVMRILDSKNENDRGLSAGAPLIKDNLCTECAGHFTGLTETLDALKIVYEVDGTIVRGLDYYTKTAFEITSGDLGSQDALVGGGRYDLLVSQLGGKETPAVGFAAGMERLLMVMEKQKAGEFPPPAPMIFIAAADEPGKNAPRERALRLTMELRRAGMSAETDYQLRSLKAQMREADRQKARFVLVIGKTEMESGKGVLKEMASGEQTPVALDALVAHLRSVAGVGSPGAGLKPGSATSKNSRPS